MAVRSTPSFSIKSNCLYSKKKALKSRFRLYILRKRRPWHGIFCISGMDEKNYTGAVPPNDDGGIINAETVVELSGPDLAETLFRQARERLLDVNSWHELSGKALAEFQLTDPNGNAIHEKAQEGFFIRIDIPGPGTKDGDGFDWVQIEELAEYTNGPVESFAIRVRPARNPSSGKSAVAHFYSAESTSTFTVTREDNRVTAAIYDRNTKANDESGNFQDQVRNTLAGVAGRMLFSKIQWESLTDGLLSTSKP